MPAWMSLSLTSAHPMDAPSVVDQFGPPMVQQPKPISETWMSVRGMGRYRMVEGSEAPCSLCTGGSAVMARPDMMDS